MSSLLRAGFEVNDLAAYATAGWTFANCTLTATNAHQDMNGRGGSLCVRTANFSTIYTRTFSTSAQYVCFFVYFDASVPSTSSITVWAYLTGSYQCGFRMRDDGFVDLLRGAGTVMATSVGTFATGTGYWVEAYIDAQNTGEMWVKMNGTLMVSAAATDFQDLGSPYFDQLRFYSNTGYYRYFDDLAVRTGAQGTIPLTNELYCVPQYVDGNSAVAFTPSAGTNYECVDENPFSSADYVETVTATTEDRYTLQNLAVSPQSIDGVTLYIQGQRDGALTTITPLVEHSATTDYGTATSPGGGGVSGMIVENFDTCPSSGVAWTEAEVNAAIIGGKAD